ncbi:MAG TPA: DUF1849 family protein [Alphaproteobacteria bacterium]|nr:DUF1849 family protein [Alphaproteobacteria bacterium]
MARLSLAALALPLLCLPGRVLAADLIPHHAFYELKLKDQKGQSGIVDASGGMAIEVKETCDAWLTEQRLKLRVVRDEEEEVITDNNFTSWEAKDGHRYRFSVRNRLNGVVNEELRGEAEIGAKGGTAKFTLPERREVALPKGTLFPTAHVGELLDAARKGVHIFRRTVFDGATVDGPDEINVVIEAPVPLEKLPGLDQKIGAPAWPMRWAFFPISSTQATPDYELAMRMLDDGVVVGLTLVYEDFEVTGKITFFAALPKPKC